MANENYEEGGVLFIEDAVSDTSLLLIMLSSEDKGVSSALKDGTKCLVFGSVPASDTPQEQAWVSSAENGDTPLKLNDLV